MKPVPLGGSKINLGLVYIMDYKVAPWKMVFANGPSSFYDFRDMTS
jgi:hypothetical protein